MLSRPPVPQAPARNLRGRAHSQMNTVGRPVQELRVHRCEENHHLLKKRCPLKRALNTSTQHSRQASPASPPGLLTAPRSLSSVTSALWHQLQDSTSKPLGLHGKGQQSENCPGFRTEATHQESQRHTLKGTDKSASAKGSASFQMILEFYLPFC